MVPSFTRNADRPTSSIGSASSSNVPLSSLPINGKENQSSCLACVRKSLKERGISKGCPKYCFLPGYPVQSNITNQHRNHPTSCPFNIVLEFLTDLFDKGFQYQTVNTCRSAISMTRLPVDGSLIGSHPPVSRFMKGVFQSRPPCPRYLATWDVSVVLSYLRTLSPKEDLSLTEVTLKLIMLMDLVCATGADILHKLDLQFRVFRHGGVSFTVPQLTKTPIPKKPSLKLCFPAFPQDQRLT